METTSSIAGHEKIYSPTPLIIKGDVAVDDRGLVRFVNDFSFEGVKRFYLVENHQIGFVRAWHGHKKEGKYALVTHGSVLVAVVPIGNWEHPNKNTDVSKYVLSDVKSSVLWIPPGYANGFKTLTPNAKIMFFSTSALKESLSDDYRWSADYFGDVWSVPER